MRDNWFGTAIVVSFMIMVFVAAVMYTWEGVGDAPWEDTAPAVETHSVRCAAALELREATVQAGIGSTTFTGRPVSVGKLPRSEYDRLLTQAAREIAHFC